MAERHISPADLVTLSKLPRATVYALFNPNRQNESLRFETLSKIAFALQTTVEYLHTGTNKYTVDAIAKTSSIFAERLQQDRDTFALAAYNLRLDKLARQVQDTTKAIKDFEASGIIDALAKAQVPTKPLLDMLSQLQSNGVFLQSLENAKRLQEIADKFQSGDNVCGTGAGAIGNRQKNPTKPPATDKK